MRWKNLMDTKVKLINYSCDTLVSDFCFPCCPLTSTILTVFVADLLIYYPAVFYTYQCDLLNKNAVTRKVSFLGSFCSNRICFFYRSSPFYSPISSIHCWFSWTMGIFNTILSVSVLRCSPWSWPHRRNRFFYQPCSSHCLWTINRWNCTMQSPSSSISCLPTVLKANDRSIVCFYFVRHSTNDGLRRLDWSPFSRWDSSFSRHSSSSGYQSYGMILLLCWNACFPSNEASMK